MIGSMRNAWLTLGCVGLLATACGGGKDPAGSDSGADSTEDSGSESSDSSSESTSGSSDGSDSSSTDSTDDGSTDDGATGPKFDLGDQPDVGGGDGGEEGIPETCQIAAEVESAVGCKFFGLDLDNTGAGEPKQFAIVVSNVQENSPAEVVVEEKQNGNWVVLQGPQQIPALDSYAFELPDNHEEGSALKVGGAYRVTSDVPVVAYQFNPLDGEASHTTDASLLYPVPSWDYLHHIVGYEVTIGAGSYITIVGGVDGTDVEITVADPTVAGTGIPAGVPGVPFNIQLDEGDMAQIATETQGNSMTGTRVVTDEDHPVGVFSATECTNVGPGACDHMEEMITGLRLWGMEFVASRMPVRNMNAPEETIWQIYASEDGTTVTLDADQEVTGLPMGPIQLDAGEMSEFWATGTPANPGDFRIEADKPIAVMSYLIGHMGDGDPAMLQISPVEQFLPRYVLLVPETWINDYLIITRYAGSEVLVDGVAVPDMEFIPVGDGDFEVARVLTPDGVHTVDGSGDPVSVSVVGYDSYDSYAYLGGVGTAVINPDPQG